MVVPAPWRRGWRRTSGTPSTSARLSARSASSPTTWWSRPTASPSRAPRVVLSVPPALALDIAFDPVMPADRQALYRGMVAGPESKTLLVYDEPFWRADGFSGQTSEPSSAAEVTIDASPADGRYGVLASFTFSGVAEGFDALEERERRQILLDTLAARLGPRAANPVTIVETAWWHQEWTRGCSMAHFRPGVLTQPRPPPARAVGTHPLGGHRDGDDLPRGHRRRHPLGRARRRRDPRPQLSRDPGRSSRFASRYSVSPGGWSSSTPNTS